MTAKWLSLLVVSMLSICGSSVGAPDEIIERMWDEARNHQISQLHQYLDAEHRSLGSLRADAMELWVFEPHNGETPTELEINLLKLLKELEQAADSKSLSEETLKTLKKTRRDSWKILTKHVLPKADDESKNNELLDFADVVIRLQELKRSVLGFLKEYIEFKISHERTKIKADGDNIHETETRYNSEVAAFHKLMDALERLEKNPKYKDNAFSKMLKPVLEKGNAVKEDQTLLKKKLDRSKASNHEYSRNDQMKRAYSESEKVLTEFLNAISHFIKPTQQSNPRRLISELKIGYIKSKNKQFLENGMVYEVVLTGDQYYRGRMLTAAHFRHRNDAPKGWYFTSMVTEAANQALNWDGELKHFDGNVPDENHRQIWDLVGVFPVDS